MTDSTRDLIQQLADELDTWLMAYPDVQPARHYHYGVDLLAKARAYLDQPEPEGLTDKEILEIYDQFDIDGTEDMTKGMPLDAFWDSYQPQQLISSARTILATDRARCNRPAVEPVPEGPTDEEILDLSEEHGVSYTRPGGEVIYLYQDGTDMKDDVLSFARALIAADRARWGRPTTTQENNNG